MKWNQIHPITQWLKEVAIIIGYRGTFAQLPFRLWRRVMDVGTRPAILLSVCNIWYSSGIFGPVLPTITARLLPAITTFPSRLPELKLLTWHRTPAHSAMRAHFPPPGMGPVWRGLMLNDDGRLSGNSMYGGDFCMTDILPWRHGIRKEKENIFHGGGEGGGLEGRAEHTNEALEEEAGRRV